jgi:hypothetical protein
MWQASKPLNNQQRHSPTCKLLQPRRRRRIAVGLEGFQHERHVSASHALQLVLGLAVKLLELRRQPPAG